MTERTLIICNSRSATLSRHALAADGSGARLVDTLALPVPGGENIACAMACNAERTRLYLAWRGTSRRLLSFSLHGSHFDPRLIHTTALADDICYLHYDNQRRQLLAAGGDTVAIVVTDEDDGPGPRLAVGAMAHSVIALPGGDLLATACRCDRVLRLRRAADGRALAIAEILEQPAHSGPRHVCADAAGRFAYLVSQESGEIVVIALGERLQERQRLTMVDGAVAAFQPMGGDIAITPDGRFVLATERTSNRLLVFAVDADGMLTRSGGADVPDYPRAISVDPGGRFVTVLGFRGHQAEIFAIGPDGRLASLARLDTGERPSWALTL